MKRYLIFGVMVFGLVGCMTTFVKSNDDNKSMDTNKTIVDIDSKKKRKIVNLDKELKKDSLKVILRGNENKIIPISIYEYRGSNDEVVFRGDLLQKADRIKIGTNDEVALDNAVEYIVKTSELKDGDMIFLMDKKRKNLIEIKIRTK